ncbi:MAG: LIC12162 family protein, partial [Candidatus Hodarchaeota archaeon]
QLRVRQFAEKYLKVPLEINLLQNNIQWDFKDTLDHQQNGVLSPLYNEWLYSKLFEKVLPPKWKILWRQEQKKKKAKINYNLSFKRKLVEWYSYHISSSSVYGIGRLETLFWEMMLKLKTIFISFNDENPAYKSKETNKEIDWDLDFDSLVEATMPSLFKQIKELTAKLKVKKVKRLYLIGPVLWYHEKQKLKLAHALEAGSRLIVTQHGGNYGNAKVYPFSSSIEYNQFKFYSWGWTNQENYKGNIVPLPSPLLSRLSKHAPKNNNLILVGTRASLFSYRIDSVPQAAQEIYYRKQKLEFILGIRQEVRDNFYYRPDSNEQGALKDKQYIKDKIPWSKFCEGDLHSKMTKCKLVVLDHPGTTLNIALAANVPTICFWDNIAWAMCFQAEPYFDQLKEAGILFNSGKEAAQKVNEIWSDIQVWWNQKEIQTTRVKWVRQYAHNKNTWQWDWLKAIWKT